MYVLNLMDTSKILKTHNPRIMDLVRTAVKSTAFKSTATAHVAFRGNAEAFKAFVLETLGLMGPRGAQMRQVITPMVAEEMVRL